MSTETITMAQILAERGRTHGDFERHAEITQRIKFVMTGSYNWNCMSYCQREALDMIAHKIGRILAGDPSYKDHWVDIAGYAQLVADRCER